MNCNDDDVSIKVLIVNDSVVMRSVLARMLKSTPRIQICGFANDGVEAVEKAKQLEPDVITLDIEMPLLDGIGALKQIMRERPCPVIMVSSMTYHGAQVTLDALSAGAFDYIPKEELCRDATSLYIRHVLLDRIEAAARSPLSPCRHRLLHNTPAAAIQRSPSDLGQTQSVPKIVAMGASTGGPKALEDILTSLPGDFPVPVVVVQHMPPGFTALSPGGWMGFVRCECTKHARASLWNSARSISRLPESISPFSLQPVLLRACAYRTFPRILSTNLPWTSPCSQSRMFSVATPSA